MENNSGTAKPAKITKGVLRGEVSSPFLFSLLLGDSEEFLKTEVIRGVSMDHLIKVILLTYADDIALLADT